MTTRTSRLYVDFHNYSLNFGVENRSDIGTEKQFFLKKIAKNTIFIRENYKYIHQSR